MKRLSIILILVFLSFQSFACFELKNIKLKNHLFITGMSVNHRFIFTDSKGKPIEDLGYLNITDLSGKENRKSSVRFDQGVLRLNDDQLPQDDMIQIEFITLKKEIRIKIDKTKAAAKSILRSNSGCGGELKFTTY